MDLSIVVAAGDALALERTAAALRVLAADVVVAPYGAVSGTLPAGLRAVAPQPTAYRAFNAGAAEAQGTRLVFLHAGVAPAPGALERLADALNDPAVGIAVPALGDAARRIESAGRALVATRMSRFRFDTVPLRAGETYEERSGLDDVALASAACLAIAGPLFADLGGFAEGYADALGDLELSLRVRARGLRVVCVRGAFAACEPGSASVDAPLRMTAARARLDAEWGERAAALVQPPSAQSRETRVAPERYLDLPAPARPITLFVHGEVRDPARLADAIRGAGAPLARIVWNAAAPVPDGLGATVAIDRAPEATAAARNAMELRGDRALAFVDAAFPLAPGWLGALVRELAWGADVLAATFAADPPADRVLPSADARATLLALPDIPQHVRLDTRVPLDDALLDLCARLRPCGLVVRAADAHPFAPEIERGRSPLGLVREPPVPRTDGLASIIMLSWNAPSYTKIALESIRAHTHHPYEVIIVDNGSGPETTDWLRTLDDVRVIYNPENRGFAGGNNQGIAAARGEYIVILNNDVVVTEGWLEDLIDGLRRNPLTGVTAPRSNRVAGSQLIPDANYPDVDAMHRYAAERRARWRKSGFYVERAIGFCLCVNQRVIDEIGGIDERFGAGNFEDDDFCLRVRAAGYRIFVCDDVFIHHFGSVTFAANNVDWHASMSTNWLTFARKWGFPDAYPANGYFPQPVIARGFDRTHHYVPLPALEPEGADGAAPPAEQPAAASVARKDVGVRFAVLVRDEADWTTVGAFVRRFGRAFPVAADVALEIAACGSLGAAAIGERVVRLLERNGLDPDAVAEIGIDDVPDVDAWLEELRPAALVRIQPGAFGGRFDGLDLIEEQSPSGLRRALERLRSPA